MTRIPGMPLLPGSVFRDYSISRFPKSQSLQNNKGINMLSDRQPVPLIDPSSGIVPANYAPTQITSTYTRKLSPKLPPWLAYDKQVLCFNAHFKENLQEIYYAPYQVRKVKIFYYLEDGTMQIIEPKVDNSGIPQGCLVHRQRIRKTPPTDREFVSILDLNVDSTIQIFDRVYHITGCDLFTRHFLNKTGIVVPAPVDEPNDPTTEIRKRADLKYNNVPPKKHPFAQFLEFDRHVLKFSGYWDDNSEFGDVRKLEICYYLADDTMDIKEIFPRNSGREGPSTFLRRAKLPRVCGGPQLPGERTPATLLNVLGNHMRDVRYVTDPLDTGRKEFLYYTDEHLKIGSVLHVFGRVVVLTSCDAFTQTYYRQKYGIEDFTPAPIPVRAEDCLSIKPAQRQLPPYNGWGSYEDSEGNCISVEPKPPQMDFKKFVQLDRHILRFGAKLISPIRENRERVFIISYYLSDDTIQVFETAGRNSGFQGGEFMKRSRIPLPGQQKFMSQRPQYFQPYHFHIGATVSLKDHIFHIVSADEHTLIYMEQHPFEFPFADVMAIMKKIREAMGAHYKEFLLKCLPEGVDEVHQMKFIEYDTLKRALVELIGDNIMNHEILTVCRFYSTEQTPPPICNRDTVRAAVKLELKRSLWNALDALKEHLQHINPTHRPFLAEMKIRSALKGCRLPFTQELIDDILLVLKRNDNSEVDVGDLLHFLDVDGGGGQLPDIAPMNIAFELCPKIPFLHKGRLIDINRFLQHLDMRDQAEAEEKQGNDNLC